MSERNGSLTPLSSNRDMNENPQEKRAKEPEYPFDEEEIRKMFLSTSHEKEVEKLIEIIENDDEDEKSSVEKESEHIENTQIQVKDYEDVKPLLPRYVGSVSEVKDDSLKSIDKSKKKISSTSPMEENICEEIHIDLHMHAIYTLASSKSGLNKFGNVSVSIILFLLQIYVFILVSFSFIQPTCRNHSDCPTGTFCELGSTKRCNDCTMYIDQERNFTDFLDSQYLGESCLPKIQDDYNLTSTSIWSTEVFHPWSEYNHDIGDSQLEDTSMEVCRAIHHCLKTDAIDDKCDFIFRNQHYLDATSILTLILAAASIVALIGMDIKATRDQEEYLFRHAPNGLMKHILGSLSIAKRFGLPIVITRAAIFIYSSLPLQPLNILFSSIAIILIQYSDKLISKAIISSRREAKIQKHYQTSMQNHLYGSKDTRGVFMDGIIIATSFTLLLLCVLGLEQMTDFEIDRSLSNTFDTSCTGIANMIYLISWVALLFLVLANVLCMLLWDPNKKRRPIWLDLPLFFSGMNLEKHISNYLIYFIYYPL
ncbi:predicted protein [Chaetoceros tenuissimus]|uniref:Uncharacterized protein n=1 Tax=Chaetoceros tenuissimus TaxID=426638 RepID=A0AAD3GYW6_9STRA|nr:predicted protein [Chaetoceros tenuissimus]